MLMLAPVQWHTSSQLCRAHPADRKPTPPLHITGSGYFLLTLILIILTLSHLGTASPAILRSRPATLGPVRPNGAPHLARPNALAGCTQLRDMIPDEVTCTCTSGLWAIYDNLRGCQKWCRRARSDRIDQRRAIQANRTGARSRPTWRAPGHGPSPPFGACFGSRSNVDVHITSGQVQ